MTQLQSVAILTAGAPRSLFEFIIYHTVEEAVKITCPVESVTFVK